MMLKKLLLMLTFLVLLGSTAFAQLQTVYVDYTNGNDVNNSGANPDNSVINAGPVKTITVGLTKLAEGGTLVIAATTTGLNEYGNVTITKGCTLKAVANASGPFQEVSINNLNFNDGTAPKGPFTITSDGTAYFNVAGTLTLTSGTVNLANASYLRVASGGTIDMYQDAAAFSGNAPQKGTNLNLTYSGGGSAAAGLEASYGTYGSGVLTLQHTAGTVTFASNITCSGITSTGAGSATFNGAVNLGAFDLTNTGGGTLTFGSTVDFAITDGTADANLGSVENTGTGKIIINGTTTWTSAVTAARTFAAGAGTYVIVNDPGANSGEIQINGGITFLADKDGDITLSAINENTAFNGNLTIGAVTAAAEATNSKVVILNVDNSATGTLTLNGGAIRGNVVNTTTGNLTFAGSTTITGNLTNTSTGKINVNAATSVAGVFTDNGAGGEVKLTGANLTLSNTGSVNQSHVTSTGSFTGSGKLILAGGKTGQTKDINGGTFSNIEVASGAIGWSVITNALVATGNIDVNSDLTAAVNFTLANGTFTVGGGTFTYGSAGAGAITLNTKNFSQTGGTVTFVANGANLRTVNVKSNFSRTGGAFSSSVVTSRLLFDGTSGSTFNPGASLKIGQVKFDEPFQTITVQQSFEALDAADITANTVVNLGNYNLNLSGASIVTLAGTYNSTGGGGIQFIGTGGSGGSLRGTATYSNIIVASTNNVKVDANNVKWSGQLTLNNAGIDVNDGVNDATNVDLSPIGSSAKIVRNINVAGTVITGLTDGTTLGTFNASAVQYDLEYIGTLTANRAVGGEFDLTKVRDFAVNADKNAGGGGPWAVQLPADPANSNAPQTLTINGNLTIGPNALVTIPTDAAAITLNLAKDNGVHSIRGIFDVTDATDVLQISGANATLSGATASTDPATVDNFVGNSTTGLSITGIKSFSGTFTTGASSVVSLGMGSAAADQAITGAVTLGGSSFTLTSNIEVKAGVTHNLGSFNFGSNNVTISTAGNYTRAAAASAVYTGTGYLIQNVAGTVIDLNNGSIANVEIKANTTLNTADASNNAITVTGLLKHTAGAITLTKNLTVSGNVTETAGSYAGAGSVSFTGDATTITAAQDVTYPGAVTVNTASAAGIVKFETSDIANATPTVRTFTSTGVFTQTKGNVDLSVNILKLILTGADALSRGANAGTWTMTSGKVAFDNNGVDAATAFNPGTDWSVKNMSVKNNSATPANKKLVTNDDKTFTVTGTLELIEGKLNTEDGSGSKAGLLHLADGSTIAIDASIASLNEVPTFDGLVNVTYQTAGGNTAKELPTSTTAINNLKVSVNTTLTANATVNGSLILDANTFTTTGKTLTIASGKTVVRKAGTISDAPSVTNYNLTYTGNNNNNKEFVSGKIDVLTVDGVGLTLVSNGTVKDVVMSKANSTIALAGFTLTSTGNLNLTNASITGAGKLSLGGTTVQTLTAPAAGLQLTANMELNNAAGVTLAGGDLQLNGGANTTLYFVKGVLSTGNFKVVLKQTATGQGFDHSGVVYPNVSHISGNVAHSIFAGAGTPTNANPNGRFEFPTGTTTQYRPFSITFSASYPAQNPVTMIVNNVQGNPDGTVNLDAGNNNKIANYPQYYWLVSTTPSSFTSTQLFDIEMSATNIGIPYTSDQLLRIIRRQDGAAQYNPWSLQGASANYANYSVITGTAPTTDTTAVVRSTASIGGIVTQGTRFTVGVPARTPSFGATATVITVAEAATSANTLQITATPQNSGETITGYTKVSGPTWAAVNATSGLLTLTPGYTDYSATAYPVVVRATSSLGLTADITINVTVTNTDRAPVMAAGNPTTGAAKTGVQLSLTYAATDADGDAITYSVVADKAVSAAPAVSAAGVLTWTPVFADIALSPVTFTVTAKSGTPNLTATTATVVTVTASAAKGDADLNGTVAALDASAILNHVVGKTLITSAEALWAADANNDGVVGALDAAWVLYKVVNGAFPTAKMVAAQGAVEFGKFVSNKGTFSLPINLTNSRGVMSVYSEVALGGDVEYKGVSTTLPEGWQVASSFENGVLKIAMAGTSALVDGPVAVVNLTLKNAESSVNVNGTVMMNDEVSASMQSVKVREIPSDFSLSQNYPNPFNPTTTIKYAVAQDARVNLVVYNILGQAVRTLVNAEQEAGFYRVNWDGTNDFGSKVASGIYIYRITAGNFVQTIKMNLLK